MVSWALLIRREGGPACVHVPASTARTPEDRCWWLTSRRSGHDCHPGGDIHKRLPRRPSDLLWLHESPTKTEG